MATMGQFGNKMRTVRADELAQGVDRRVRMIALAVFSELAISTPVDTGRARSNWSVAFDRPPDTDNEAPFVPGKDGSTAGPNAQAAIDAAKAALSDYKSGQEVHLGNNLPYIGRLNEGWSAQAPAGFVQTAVQDGLQQARNAQDRMFK